MAYTYNPENLATDKKDRMRFEIGDTDTAGGPDTCLLTDEEITGILAIYPTWKMAKFKLVESVYMRFAKEVQTSVAGLSLGYQARAEHWSNLYNTLKKEISVMGAPKVETTSPPYFYTGMMNNPQAGE